MFNSNVCLKQNVLVEPLSNQWYSWPYLIFPATVAMYITNQHLKIMQSFIANPDLHVSALKNPAMIGGPFINYPASRVNEIKSLYEKTLKEQTAMIQLAQAIKELDEMLATHAEGTSLEPLYQKVPDLLRGYVELVYDLNNKPSVRFIEGLLYKSRLYNPSLQSITLSSVENDGRPFVFSTPRLKTENQLHLNIPFNSEGLDELFKMKFNAGPFERIREQLGVRDEDEELFSSFFTTEPPPQRPVFTGDGVRIRYFNHACVLIETAGVSILTDPVMSYKYGESNHRFTYADLPEKLDYVLITHNHQDHCMFEPLLQLRPQIKNLIVPASNGGTLADPSLKQILRQVGFENVHELGALESIEVEDGSITGLPFLGEHADLDIRTKIAYLIKLKGKSILCAADSNNIEPRLYENLHELFGDIDVVFLGMECDGAPLSWLYGPLMTKPLSRKMDQSRRFDGSDFEKALDIVDRFHPSRVYVYAMGQEPWLTFLTSIQYTAESRPIVESDKLINACRERGIQCERVFERAEIML
jgi:L-ascorbate metabolism protein UlaG (beta-lactamase superfamily)